MGSLEGRIGGIKKDCQAMRREGIIHHRERLYPFCNGSSKYPAGYIEYVALIVSAWK
jgi:hypothetical protein